MSRFILDLKSLDKTSNEDSTIVASSIHFTTSIAEDIGARLKDCSSTWLSNAAEEISGIEEVPESNDHRPDSLPLEESESNHIVA